MDTSKDVTDTTNSSAERPLPLREKLAYAAGDVGSNFVFAPTNSFVLFYLTNIAGVQAAIAGTILLIGQLFNGVADIVVGVFLEKTNTRWGRFRPWILFTAVPLAVSFVLLFSMPPGLGDTGKIVWVAVTYTLVIAVFFTASNVAYSALMSVMTGNPHARLSLGALRVFAALITSLAVNVVTLPAVDALGGGQGGWTGVTGIYGVITVCTLLIVFFGTRERLTPTPTAQKESVSRPIRELLKRLLQNRYFYIVTGLYLCFIFSMTLGSTSGVYYASVILGDSAYFGLLSVGQMLPLIVGIAFMPKLMTRYGKRRVFLVGIVLQIVGAAIPLIAPTDMTVVMIGLVVRGAGIVPFAAGLYPAVADVVDYGEWKFGVRIDGLTYSAVTVGQKVGGGLAVAATGWILAAGGYQPDSTISETAVAQSIYWLYIYIPVLLAMATGLLAHAFTVERYATEIADHRARLSDSHR